MAIRRFNRPTAQKAERRHRTTSNPRLIQSEAKGHTSQFDELIKAAGTVLESGQLDDPMPGVVQVVPGGALQPVQPAFHFNHLARLVINSNTLRQCIESYVVNIEGNGYTLEYIGPEGKEDGPEPQAEKAQLEAFLSFCAPENSLREVREKTRWDQETLGVKFYEVSRAANGRIVMFDHVPGVTMRRTLKDPEPVEFMVEVPNPADPTQMVRKTVSRTFCRYIQTVVNGGGSYERVFFKEFGDPRPIDPKDGQVNEGLAIEDQATEILMVSLYTPGSVYGLPRWIGQLPSILGSRESELVNLNFFRENAIPAMAILISGGALTAESFQVIQDYLTAVKGQKSMHRMLVLEATGDDVSGATDSSVSAPKIDMKPMTSERQQDGLFKDYDAANQEKIRSAFRLPPIYSGRAQDYTRASAFASMVTAEQQIFGPERAAFDDMMNNKILKTYRPKFWRFKTTGVPLTDPDSLSTMLTTLDAAGALTPNAVIKIANKILDIQIEPVTEVWGDYPWAAVMQYIASGAEVKGLSKFITDVKKLPLNQPEPDPATSVPPNAQGTNTTETPRTPQKSKSKNTSVKKTDGFDGFNDARVRQIVRAELHVMADDLQQQIDELQVPAK